MKNLISSTRSIASRFTSKMSAAFFAMSLMLAPGFAFAQSTSPGSAIASELSTGKGDVMLVVGAAAIIIGVLVLWSYVKRAK